MSDELTPYGFTWGPMEVVRIAAIPPTFCLEIVAGKNRLTVYVSPSGRSVRAFKNGKELK